MSLDEARPFLLLVLCFGYGCLYALATSSSIAVPNLLVVLLCRLHRAWWTFEKGKGSMMSSEIKGTLNSI